MAKDHLITAIRKRAEDRSKRTDCVDIECPELGALASPEVVLEAQRAMGCILHPLHRRLFEEVANGGFGPGYGLIGLPGGILDSEGRSLVELREILWIDSETPMPHPVVPLCDWGCGIWSCLDSETGAMALCSAKADVWECQTIKDQGLDLTAEIGRLKAEDDRLKARVTELEKGGGPIKLPSDQEVDRMIDIFGKMFDRFLDFAREMDGKRREGSSL